MVSLRDVQPPIWRQLLVPADLDLERLHDALQVAMGWTDHHLHAFRVGDRIFSPRFPDLEPIGEESYGVPLFEVAPRPGDAMVYEYDFGDGWEHTIVVEAILDEPCAALRCLDGARACPPEDCGGPWGYQNLLEALGDPQHESHREFLDWVGDGFDAEAFDPSACDTRLRQTPIDAPS